MQLLDIHSVVEYLNIKIKKYGYGYMEFPLLSHEKKTFKHINSIGILVARTILKRSTNKKIITVASIKKAVGELTTGDIKEYVMKCEYGLKLNTPVLSLHNKIIDLAVLEKILHLKPDSREFIFIACVVNDILFLILGDFGEYTNIKQQETYMFPEMLFKLIHADKETHEILKDLIPYKPYLEYLKKNEPKPKDFLIWDYDKLTKIQLEFIVTQLDLVNISRAKANLMTKEELFQMLKRHSLRYIQKYQILETLKEKGYDITKLVNRPRADLMKEFKKFY